MAEDRNLPSWRAGCLVLTVAMAYGLWLLFHGVWFSHAQAESPDGQRVVESRNLYNWGIGYGWNHFYLRVRPPVEFRCKTLTFPWRRTPDDITSWKYDHHYATYNDFDGEDRFPKSIRWVSNNEFVVLGGEGDGSVFEIRR